MRGAQEAGRARQAGRCYRTGREDRRRTSGTVVEHLKNSGVEKVVGRMPGHHSWLRGSWGGSEHLGVYYVRGAGLYYDRGVGLQRIAG